MVGQSSRHRWRTRLPHFAEPLPLVALGPATAGAARVWQHEVVVDVEQRQLMLQAVLTLAQRVDPAPDAATRWRISRFSLSKMPY